MRMGRAIRLEGMLTKFWKSACIERLTELFNITLKTSKMPRAWRWSTMIPMFKTRVIFRIVTTIGHQVVEYMKVWERKGEMRVRKSASITENQFGFMSGHSTT